MTRQGRRRLERTRDEQRRIARELLQDPTAFEVAIGNGQVAITFLDELGTLFVTKSAGMIVIEAVVATTADMSTAQRHARHEELSHRARLLFGDGIDFHDPLGLRGGPKAVFS